MNERCWARRGVWLVFLLFAAVVADCRFGDASEVSVRKNERGEWNLLVDGKPYFIRGISYIVNKVGESPEAGHPWKDWAWSDIDRNGQIDGPYDAWVDRNANNRRDPDEPAVGDFKLMKEMRVNTVRWYTNAYPPDQKTNKELLRDLFRTYGIRTIVGDYLGAYCIGSGAAWDEGTDYRDSAQRAKMLQSVRRMVAEHKDEPYLLFWLLGNENVYPFVQTNAAAHPEAYAKFLNEAAVMIHQLDGRHPVAFCNGEDRLLDYYVKFTPDMDIFGTNSYKGPFGFGPLWNRIKKAYDKPMFLAEYGGNQGFDDKGQVVYYKGCWKDIEKNRAGGTGAGNSIGGLAFEWLDRWWTAGEPLRQAPVDLRQNVSGGITTWNQEYAGFCTQGDGSQSPFLRRLRPVYQLFRDDLWNKPNAAPNGDREKPEASPAVT